MTINNKKKKPMSVVFFYEPTMMLLIGIWMSLTKKPIKPIMAKPIAVAIAIFWNSNWVEKYVFNSRNEEFDYLYDRVLYIF